TRALYKMHGVIDLYRVQIDGSRLQGSELGFTNGMNGVVLAIDLLYRNRILTGVDHIIDAKTIERRLFGDPRFGTHAGIQFISRYNGFPYIATVLIYLHFDEEALFDLVLGVLTGFQYIVPVYVTWVAPEGVRHVRLEERITAKRITTKRTLALRLVVGVGRARTAGMNGDDNSIGLHVLPVDHRRCAADGKFPCLNRLEHEGQGLVLGHITVDDAHAAGLNGSLHHTKTGEIGGIHVIDLFGIFDDEFYL